MIKSWGCPVSACLFLLATTSSWWWLILLWPIPLWYTSWWQGITTWDICLWYAIAAGGHLVGICVGLYRLAHGCWYAKLTMPVLVLGYYFMVTYIWMAGTSYGVKLLYPNSMQNPLALSARHFIKMTGVSNGCGLKADIVHFLCMWAVTTWVYIIFVCDYSLVICGVSGGYSLFSPLIPLVEHPALLWPLPFLGERLFLFFMLIFQALCTGVLIHMSSRLNLKNLNLMKNPLALSARHFIKMTGTQGERTRKGFGFSILCRIYVKSIVVCFIAFWWGGAWIMPQASHSANQDYSGLGVVTSQFFEQDGMRAIGHIVGHVRDLHKEHQSVACTLFPESCVYGEHVFPEKGESIGTSLLYQHNMIIGGFRRCGGRCYNTVWFIKQGYVLDYWDKQEALPITEYIPWWGRACGIGNNFFTTMSELACPEIRTRPVWEIVPGLNVVPYICSEFFLAHAPRDVHSGAAVLAVCNNVWALNITRRMMLRAAILRALSWQRTVIYVAHSYASVITSSGTRYGIVAESHVCGAK